MVILQHAFLVFRQVVSLGATLAHQNLIYCFTYVKLERLLIKKEKEKRS